MVHAYAAGLHMYAANGCLSYNVQPAFVAALFDEANKTTAFVCACSTIRNNNLRWTGRSSSEKAPKWLVDQNEEFFKASSGLVALMRAEWEAGTFTPGLKAMVS